MKSSEKKKYRIIVFHLLNNFSGSPYVLASSIKALRDEGYEIVLFTSKTYGFLSNIEGITYRSLIYRWSYNNFILLSLFILSQFQIFCVAFFYSFRKQNIFYINTILPFGAAVAAFLSGNKVIYHVHEFYLKPNFMQKMAWYVMNKTALKIIVVSNYLSTQINIPTTLIPNTLSFEFTCKAKLAMHLPKDIINDILMISSLTPYKGIYLFIELARILPDYKFCLIIAAKTDEIGKYFRDIFLPNNIKILPMMENLHEIYRNSKILVNLTIPNLCVETFGLTILEAMTYGLPIIAPPVGGPAELVQDNVNGYLLNPSNIELVANAISRILNDDLLYNQMSQSSLSYSEEYSFEMFSNKISKLFNEYCA